MRIIFFFALTFFTSNFIFSQSTLPSVELKTLEGKKVTLDELIKKDELTLISFWATWCGPCKKELNNIKPHYAEWKEKYKLTLIAISIDDVKSAAKVPSNVSRYGWEYTVLSDINKDLYRALNVPDVPYSILIDQNKNIVWSHSGYLDGDEYELENRIKELTGMQ